MSVAWRSDGKRLATGSADHSVKIWDVQTGAELITLSGHDASVMSVAWSPNGKWLASASEDQTVQVYAIDFRNLMTLARHRMTAQPPPQGCKTYIHKNCPPFPVLSC